VVAAAAAVKAVKAVKAAEAVAAKVAAKVAAAAHHRFDAWSVDRAEIEFLFCRNQPNCRSGRTNESRGAHNTRAPRFTFVHVRTKFREPHGLHAR
jgi:hypothetical protein